jgi:hypothetical protein
MIAPIDGSDPRNDPQRQQVLMPGIDRFRRNPRGGDAQAMRQGMRKRQLWGCDSDRTIFMAMNGIGPWP